MTDHTEPNPFEQLLDVAKQILNELKVSNAESRLWDVSDIALYLKCSKTNAQINVIGKPEFPKAFRPSGHPRWKPSEVKEWADTCR